MPSEFDIIAQYFTRAPRSALLGVGDDCALVRPGDGLVLAITTDMLVEGTHFFPGAEPRALGHKTLAVNLSDIAAMGADPRWATLAIALPEVEEAWIGAFAEGFFALADRFGVELIGGDTTRGPLSLCVTIFGSFPPGLALRRDGARAGDEVWLSGATGEAALAVAARKGAVTLEPSALAACAERLDRPEPRVALGRALRTLATSAIDVSDGVLADLGHICERSKLAAEIEWASVPRTAVMQSVSEAVARVAVLAGGDDYELLFTAPAEARGAVLAAGTKSGVPVTRIGRMLTSGSGVVVKAVDGTSIVLPRSGFDHFA